jgi:hypothetical protein
MKKAHSLRLVSWLIAFIVLPSDLSAKIICVTCAPPTKAFRCEIGKSDAIESLPFGHQLLERACVKAIKATEVAAKCRAEIDALCNSAPTRNFSLKEAKRALTDDLDPATGHPATIAGNTAGAGATSESPSSAGNPLSVAWARFLAMFKWH